MFKAWAAALVLTSVCTALCLPWVPRSVFPKATSLLAVAVTTQTSQHKGLGDCFQVDNDTCTGLRGIGVFCWERHIAKVPELNRSLGLLSPVGKRRFGLQTVMLCGLSKRYGNVPPNFSFTAFQRPYCSQRCSFLMLFYFPFSGSLFTVLCWCSEHTQEEWKEKMCRSQRCREGTVKLATALWCDTTLPLLIKAVSDRDRALYMQVNNTWVLISKAASQNFLFFF